MSNEHTSILLEIMSFFLVTTDLYGNKRLENLKEKIIERKIGDISEKKLKIIAIVILIILLASYTYWNWKNLSGDFQKDFLNGRHFNEFGALDWIKYLGFAILVLGFASYFIIVFAYILSYILTAVFALLVYMFL